MATKSLCRACGLTFASVAAFDAHRTGAYGEPIYAQTRSGKPGKVIGYTPHTRRCMTLADIRALGMTPNDKGWWMLPKQSASAAHEDEEEPEEAMP